MKNGIQYDLKKNDQRLWKKVIHTLRVYERMEKDLFEQEIKKNAFVPNGQKKIKPLKRDDCKIYEFRIPPSRKQSVCRIYFKHYSDKIFIFDFEAKTDKETRIDSAFERYKKIKATLERDNQDISF